METYDIIRFYQQAGIRRRTIARGLSLAAAQAHCTKAETSSTTAKGKTGRARTRRLGIWFDGYEAAK